MERYWVIKCFGNIEWQLGSLATLSVPSGRGVGVVFLCIVHSSSKTVLFTLALDDWCWLAEWSTPPGTLSRDRLQAELIWTVNHVICCSRQILYLCLLTYREDKADRHTGHCVNRRFHCACTEWVPKRNICVCGRFYLGEGLENWVHYIVYKLLMCLCCLYLDTSWIKLPCK